MTKRISDTKPVLDFIDIARKYCNLIEDRENKTGIKLLQEAFIILPQLIYSGMKLPDIQRVTDYCPDGISYEEYDLIYESLMRKIKKWDNYLKMFDPYNRREKTPGHGSLSDDLADIYRDLQSGLYEWDKVTAPQKLDIIWEWEFGFETHWGEHATNAIRALYWLLYNHIKNKKDDGNTYIGIR
jgi:hypothetical protein